MLHGRTLTDSEARAYCVEELEHDRRAAEQGAIIKPAESPREVAIFLWGLQVADRLFPPQVSS